MALRTVKSAVLVLCVILRHHLRAQDVPTYVAAVYEHRVVLNPDPRTPLDRARALQHANRNLRVLEEQTARAARQGAQIVVLPEDSIQGFNFSRTSIAAYLESVPDPAVVTWSPCADPDKFPHTEILHSLSCMARNNGVFLVANMASRQSCDPSADPRCPGDGQYQFNTNVAFNEQGAILARYHKHNLYFEEAFDAPPECEHVTFTTPFAGVFGMFTCFDIMFREPAVTLVKDLGVRQMVYPTAWMNQLPLLAAVQFQRSFSYATASTLLAANIRSPEHGMTGSGIFTPWDSLTHHDAEGNSGKLLVHRVPVLDPKFCGGVAKLVPFSGFQEELGEEPIWSTRGLDGRHCPPASKKVSSESFSSIMMYDNFTLVRLEANVGSASVCSGSLCCHLVFRRSNTSEMLALGVFNGLHVVHGMYYLEVCALVKCAGLHRSSCGGETPNAETLVDFRLAGTFSTPHVFPGILADGMRLEIPDHSRWESGGGFYMSREGMSAGLVTAVLYGRHYEKDSG